LRPLRGKNRAVLLDLGLEFFFEAAAHPLAALGLDFQFHVAQRSSGACIRVHLLTFRSGCFHSEEEPIFPPPVWRRCQVTPSNDVSALEWCDFSLRRHVQNRRQLAPLKANLVLELTRQKLVL
jgi:hypothetical protein